MNTVFITNLKHIPGLAGVLGLAFGAPCSAQDWRIAVSTRIEGPSVAGLAVLDQINAARADPRAYATTLRQDLGHFQGDVLSAPGRAPLMTEEGASAVEAAIADLEHRAPAPPLQPDSAIAVAAMKLVADEGPSGRVGHVASDGATLRQRLETAGVWARSMEEDIAYGPSDPQEVVRELIVDDGVPDRGHRAAIFDPHMSRAGLACGPHATWRWMCVIDFTGETARSSGAEHASR